MPNPWFQVRDDASSSGDASDTSTSAGASEASSADPPGSGSEAGGSSSAAIASSSSEPAPDNTSTSEPGDPDSSSGDASTGGAPCNDLCGTPNCGDCPSDDAMIAFDQFSIHAHEVSNASYQQFLDAHVDPASQGPACLWNDSFEPTSWPVADGQLPVVNVDWCDAKAYCHWSGHRLCGAIVGDATPLDLAFKPESDQWHHACTKAGTRPFPYGAQYDPKACNVHDFDPNKDALLPVGTLSSCEAPLPGLFDLSGNVWELTDTCTGDGPDDTCLRRGGSLYSLEVDLGCYIKSLKPRKDAYHYVGFRCCSL